MNPTFENENFYNEKFWKPILENLEKIVGKLPEYKIINKGVDIDVAPNSYNEKMIEEFFVLQSEQNYATRSKFKDSKLAIVNDIFEAYCAYVRGVHRKIIIINPKNTTVSTEDNISFEIDHQAALKNILEHIHKEGFIKPSNWHNIEFKD